MPFYFANVPDQVWDDLEYEIGRNGLDYADNYRAYRVKDGYLLPEFVAARKRGCCGEFETSTIVNGDKWIVGCNYGH